MTSYFLYEINGLLKTIYKLITYFAFKITLKKVF